MNTLQKSIEQTANALNIEEDELNLWLEQHKDITPYTQVQLLRMASKHLLDPLSDEIGLMETKEGYLPFITIDGWAKLINQHPQYAGMSLREPTESGNQLPAWMECTIYRNDRILPIVVKEYLEEVMTSHPSWQQMPRRMLRHRVIQQCARLAFGISTLESCEKDEKISSTTPPNESKLKKPQSATNEVKNLLSNTRLTNKSGKERLKEIPQN